MSRKSYAQHHFSDSPTASTESDYHEVIRKQAGGKSVTSLNKTSLRPTPADLRPFKHGSTLPSMESVEFPILVDKPK